MLASYQKSLRAAFIVVFCVALGLHAYAQSGGNSGSISGTVLDPTGAVVPNQLREIASNQDHVGALASHIRSRSHGDIAGHTEGSLAWRHEVLRCVIQRVDNAK
jgi:hypothetical protein